MKITRFLFLYFVLSATVAIAADVPIRTRGDSLLVSLELETFDFSTLNHRFQHDSDRVFSGELISLIINSINEESSFGNSNVGFWYIPHEISLNGLILPNCKVEGSIEVKDKTLGFPILISNCHVSGKIEFQKCNFSSAINFDSLTISEGLYFNGCDVGEDIVLAHINSPRAEFVAFNSDRSLVLQNVSISDIFLPEMNVSRNVMLSTENTSSITANNSIVGGKLSILGQKTPIFNIDLSFCKVGGNIEVNLIESTFSLSMRSLKCGGSAVVVIQDSMNIFDARSAVFYDLALFGKENQELAPKVKLFDVSQCTTHNEAFFSRADFFLVEANNFVSRGSCEFRQASFESIKFRNSYFKSLSFIECRPPHVSGMIDFGGMKYESLPQWSGWDSPYWVAESSAFRPSVYLELENFYNEIGETENSDRLYVLRKEKIALQRGGFEQVLSWLFKVSAGYGRHLRRTLYISLAWIVLGLILFPPSFMTRTRDSDRRHRYSRFWYTVELFVPVINLRIVEQWIPRKPRVTDSLARRSLLWLAYQYTKVLPIVGFVIVTLLAAVVAGIVVRN